VCGRARVVAVLFARGRACRFKAVAAAVDCCVSTEQSISFVAVQLNATDNFDSTTPRVLCNGNSFSSYISQSRGFILIRWRVAGNIQWPIKHCTDIACLRNDPFSVSSGKSVILNLEVTELIAPIQLIYTKPSHSQSHPSLHCEP